MKATHEEMKEEAVKMLEALGIHKPYINAFKTKAQKVCMFEGYGGYYAYQYPELTKKIKEFEEKYDAIVYAVTHEMTSFGEIYDFLYVANKKSEWSSPYRENGVYYLYAYCWNKDDEWCSEIGEIGVTAFGGGIARRY